MFKRRTIRRLCTGFFHIPVRTVLPRHATSRGSPTFSDTNFAATVPPPEEFLRSAADRNRQRPLKSSWIVLSSFLTMVLAQVRPEFLDHVGRGVVSHLRSPRADHITEVPFIVRVVAVRRNGRRNACAENFRIVEFGLAGIGTRRHQARQSVPGPLPESALSLKGSPVPMNLFRWPPRIARYPRLGEISPHNRKRNPSTWAGCGPLRNWWSKRRGSGRRGGQAMSINDLPAIMGTVLIVVGLALVVVSTWS